MFLGKRSELKSLPNLKDHAKYEWLKHAAYCFTKATPLFIDPYDEYCFVDPQKANKAAVRMYEKVGFRSIQKVRKDSVVWMLREKRHK